MSVLTFPWDKSTVVIRNVNDKLQSFFCNPHNDADEADRVEAFRYKFTAFAERNRKRLFGNG